MNRLINADDLLEEADKRLQCIVIAGKDLSESQAISTAVEMVNIAWNLAIEAAIEKALREQGSGITK